MIYYHLFLFLSVYISVVLCVWRLGSVLEGILASREAMFRLDFCHYRPVSAVLSGQ